MDQQKTGSFLKRLRKQNGMTQEQLAERLGVTARTVSRWETGSNLPDLSLLIEIADLYRVDIREIIDGERKDDTMDQETKDTLKKAAEYTDAEKERLKKEEERLTKELARVNGMLGNEKFISKAPAAKIQEEKDKLAKYEQMMAQVKEQLARF